MWGPHIIEALDASRTLCPAPLPPSKADFCRFAELMACNDHLVAAMPVKIRLHVRQ